jgi:serine/threonine-protein kinase
VASGGAAPVASGGASPAAGPASSPSSPPTAPGAHEKIEADKAAAEALFQQGRALMEAGRTAEACPKFAESARLDVAAGTVLNLAECYEAVGRFASAWTRYKELDVLATRLGQTARARHAQDKVAQLEPRLAYLTLEVSKPVAGLSVRHGDTELGRGAWGVRLPVDPGLQVIVVSAPGYQAWRKEVMIKGGEARINVPALALAPTPRSEVRASPLRTAGWVGVIAGGAALGAMAGFGAAAALENDKALRDECSEGACSASGADRIDRALLFGNVATGLAIGGGVALVTGVILLIAAPSRAPARSLTPLLVRF